MHTAAADAAAGHEQADHQASGTNPSDAAPPQKIPKKPYGPASGQAITDRDLPLRESRTWLRGRYARC
jgi:hypothetical protein